MRRSVFAVEILAVAVLGCAPKPAMEPLPLDVEEEAPDTLDHPAVLPDLQVRRAHSDVLRTEPEDGYPQLRRKLRSTNPRRVQKGLEAIGRIDTMFPDRIALLQAEAEVRLGDLDAARVAYLDAIRQSNVPAVREQAARGMIAALGKAGEPTAQLEYIDGLIDSLDDEAPDWDLAIMRAETLHTIGRTRDAQDSLRSVISEYPNMRVEQKAERSLLAMSGRRRLSRADERTKLLGRVHWLARTGRLRQAQQTIAQWRRKQKNDHEAALLEADLLRDRGERNKAETILRQLAAGRDPAPVPGAMLRLARLSTDRFQYRKARQQFAEVIEKFRGSPEAIEAEFEAAELEYDCDNYEVASARMRAFTERHAEGKLAVKAAWLAGFSAHLAGTSSVAIEAFEQFLAEQPDHPTAPRARYWLARELEIVGARDRAGEIYADMVQRAPLGFYGLLAERRLHGMGVSATLDPLPPVPSPHTVEEVVSLLGPDRPIGVDRAAALFAAHLKREGVEELVGLSEEFRKNGDTQGATMVVDLFQIFGKDAWAFLLARHITEGDDSDDLARRPYYWRVWRHAFPTPFDDAVKTATHDNGLDPYLVYSVMRTESLFRPEAVSPVGARGLMQLMPQTARWIGRKDRRARLHARRYSRPEANIWLGAWYIRFLLDHYRGEVARTLGAYNAGPAAMDRWGRRFDGLDPDAFIERIPYDETRAYVRRAMESYLVYQRLHPEPSSVAQTEEPDAPSGS